MRRRELLFAAGAFVCGCATMPVRGSFEDVACSGIGRACDHDLCCYFVRAAGGETGRCSLGVPEDAALPALGARPSTPQRDEATEPPGVRE